MRCWHKDLIPVLPRKQLLGQWRECCLIAKGVVENGTPNHILVNRVMDYPISHLSLYARLVRDVMVLRGFKVNEQCFTKYIPFGPYPIWSDMIEEEYDELFKDWHNQKYLLQCMMNLQEKYDCGGLTRKEWSDVCSVCLDKIWTIEFK